MNSTPERAYYPGLDSLRGIAILLVIVYHYFPFFRIGWIGVDLFFVLSGFLITTILLNSRQHKYFFRNFYIRRVLRIFPLYYVFLLLFFICLYLFFDRSEGSVYHYYTTNNLWYLVFIQNWLIISEGPPPEPYLIHFWSLGIEEQFYLLWPFLIYFIKDIRSIQKLLIFLFLFALSLRIYLWFSNAPNQAYYYNSFARFDSLAAGAYLSTFIYRNLRIKRYWTFIAYASFLLMLLLAAFVFKNFDHNSLLFATVGYSISAVFFMIVCYQTITQHQFVFQNQVLKYIGRISFGLYVYHLPVFLVASHLIRKNLPLSNGTDPGTWIAIVSIIITLLISSVSYKLFELPLLRLKSKFI